MRRRVPSGARGARDHLRHPSAAGIACASHRLPGASGRRRPDPPRGRPRHRRGQRALEQLGPPVAAVHGNVDDPHLRLALPSARMVRAGRSTSGSSTTPGLRRDGSSACAAAFPRPTRSSSATRTAVAPKRRRRLSDLQSRQPDRAPARPAPHDGHGLRRWALARLRARDPRLTSPEWTCRCCSSAPPGRCPPPGAACRRRSCGAAGTGSSFDCGEGTQRQLLRSAGLLDLTDVFLTHYHADHWLGLPGMLKTFDMRDRDRPLTIHGPAGLRELMTLMRPVYGRTGYELSFVELDPARCCAATGTRSPPSAPTTAFPRSATPSWRTSVRAVRPRARRAAGRHARGPTSAASSRGRRFPASRPSR